jgi:hypothetical protein
MRRPLFLGVLVLTFVGMPAAAQSGPTCFRGRPAPACRWYVVLEGGAGIGIAQTASPVNPGRPDLSIQVGLMSNRGPRHALGGTLYASRDIATQRTIVAILPRYRRWLNGDVALDLAAGPAFHVGNFDGRVTVYSAGAMTEMGLNVKDLVGITSRLELLPTPWDRTGVSWHTGIRVGSYATLVAGLVAGIAAAGKAFEDAMAWNWN